MKKNILLTIMAAASLLCSCGKPDEPKEEVAEPKVRIEVSGLADNNATISVSLTQGEFHGAKIVTGIRADRLDFDYTKEVKLTQWVEENGKTINSLPYTENLSGLTYQKDYISAVIVYNKEGRACSVAYETWTAVGTPDGISKDNSAGRLDDNVIQ